MKEIYDAASSRIKSPVLGSIAFAFVFYNWKPLYFLFFSDQKTLVKFDFFDVNTNTWSLYVYPLLAGLILALIAPYISYLGSIWASRPVVGKRLL